MRLYGIKTAETSFLKLPKIYSLLRCYFLNLLRISWLSKYHFWNCQNFIECQDVIFVTVENFFSVVMLILKLSILRIKIKIVLRIETFRHRECQNIIFKIIKNFSAVEVLFLKLSRLKMETESRIEQLWSRLKISWLLCCCFWIELRIS